VSASAAHPLEFDRLIKRFGRRTVIDDLSFTVPEGSIVGLLGPNGAGKSTAMRVLLGLQHPSGGHARVLGKEAGEPGFREAVRKVGAIIESPPLYKRATALQNLEIRARAYGLSAADATVRRVLNEVGLAERADDRVGDFSLGMRQRMGLALALLGDPSIVVLDEPTNGLDPAGMLEVRDIVKALPRRGATALVCTHRLSEVEAMCDYVVVLAKGRLLRQGALADVIAGAQDNRLGVTVAPDELEVADRVLRGLDLGEVRLVDGELTTSRIPDDPSVATRALAAEGIYLRGLAVERASLEEAFMEIVAAAEETPS
jgi:ABC-type multidrug transport system ATPase subunit